MRHVPAYNSRRPVAILNGYVGSDMNLSSSSQEHDINLDGSNCHRFPGSVGQESWALEIRTILGVRLLLLLFNSLS